MFVVATEARGSATALISPASLLRPVLALTARAILSPGASGFESMFTDATRAPRRAITRARPLGRRSSSVPGLPPLCQSTWADLFGRRLQPALRPAPGPDARSMRRRCLPLHLQVGDHSGQTSLGGAVGTHMRALAQAHIGSDPKMSPRRRTPWPLARPWPAGSTDQGRSDLLQKASVLTSCSCPGASPALDTGSSTSPVHSTVCAQNDFTDSGSVTSRKATASPPSCGFCQLGQLVVHAAGPKATETRGRRVRCSGRADARQCRRRRWSARR